MLSSLLSKSIQIPHYDTINFCVRRHNYLHHNILNKSSAGSVFLSAGSHRMALCTKTTNFYFQNLSHHFSLELQNVELKILEHRKTKTNLVWCIKPVQCFKLQQCGRKEVDQNGHHNVGI